MEDREILNSLGMQITRQVKHWSHAVSRLEDLESFAAAEAWDALERYLGIAIRQRLTEGIEKLKHEKNLLLNRLSTVGIINQWSELSNYLKNFRNNYMRTETALDFYGDAINTRVNPEIASLLRACDTLATMSMRLILDRLGKSTPPVLTYLDKGLGASILKAGLRLWDGSMLNPAAVIKITRHNLLRPTSLIHESGHQVAYITGWNEELSTRLQEGLNDIPGECREMWSGWASEIAADAFAFVNTGYAAVAALHDILSGDNDFVFRYLEGDPHPVGFIRVLLGVEMCRYFYGNGPWDDLSNSWIFLHPINKAGTELDRLLRLSLPILPKIVKISMDSPMQAFSGWSLAASIEPLKVSPVALYELRNRAGNALYNSQYWIKTEAIRLLALSGFQLATVPEQEEEIMKQHVSWMTRLGNNLQLAA